MRVLLRVVDGRREKIWLGVPMPNSIPLVTATPLAETVMLLHERESGATEQSTLTAVACKAQDTMQSMEVTNKTAMIVRSGSDQSTV